MFEANKMKDLNVAKRVTIISNMHYAVTLRLNGVSYVIGSYIKKKDAIICRENFIKNFKKEFGLIG